MVAQKAQISQNNGTVERPNKRKALDSKQNSNLKKVKRTQEEFDFT